MFERISLLALLFFIFNSCESSPSSLQRKDEKLLKLFQTVPTQNKKKNCRQKQSWYLDEDKDGWGNSKASVEACSAPVGYVKKSGDCDDNDSRAHPDQRDYFARPRKNGSYDFDCDGKEKIRLSTRAYCRLKEKNTGCILASGWDISASDKIPACGQPENWAWNECRSEIVDPEPKPKPTKDASKINNEGAAITEPAAIEKPVPLNDDKKKDKDKDKVNIVYSCWKGKLAWKKRQLCR